MLRRHVGIALESLDRIFNLGTLTALSEGDLLERFVTQADETAFTALVSRHGPMVLGVCRRILRDEHDVEDAFQATFLVLVRRAGSIRDGERVSHWLHGVAHRVAVRAKANTARRSRHEQTGVNIDPAGVNKPALDDVATILDEELIRLPASLRAPVVFCYLEGLTHDEAAHRLGWPLGTVRSRMSRARRLLERRLTRRGVSAPSVALFSSVESQHVSTALVDRTVRIVLETGTQKTAASVLAQGVLTTMMISRIKIFAAALVLVAATMVGARAAAKQFGGTKPAEAPGDITAQLTQRLAKLQDEEAMLKARLAEVMDRKRALQVQLAEAINSRQPEADQDKAQPAGPGPAKRPIPNYTRFGDIIVATSPKGDKVSLYSNQTGESKAIRIFESTEPSHKVIPTILMSGLSTQQAVALFLSGPRISRIAVFSYPDSTWHIQQLREPVEMAQPILSDKIVTYSLGRFIYAFSTVATKWDVLELPVGAKASAVVGPFTATVEHDGHIYDFSAQKGKWLDLDVRTLLDAPEAVK